MFAVLRKDTAIGMIRRRAGGGIMAINVKKVRQETRGCGRMIHFNNAGSSLPPAPVVDAVIKHLKLEEEIGGYEAAAKARPLIEGAYAAVAQLINARADEIALVENATRAWDMAFYSLTFKPGDRILTARAEYASNYIAFLQMAQKTGAVIDVIPSDGTGQVSVEALGRMIDERVKLIAITHVPTNGGLVNPAAEIGAITRAHRIPYLLDACQSVGQLNVDVEAIGCDMLSATGRKYLRGPRGTGFLFVRQNLVKRLTPPFLDLHAAEWVAPGRYEIRKDARRFENWESYVAGRIGLGVAAKYPLKLGLANIEARIVSLAETLRAALAAVPGVAVHDLGQRKSGIGSFTKKGQGAGTTKRALAARHINVSVSGASSTLLDMSVRGLDDVVRASVHYYNSEDEVARFAKAVAKI